jgi:hypothetical protein
LSPTPQRPRPGLLERDEELDVDDEAPDFMSKASKASRKLSDASASLSDDGDHLDNDSDDESSAEDEGDDASSISDSELSSADTNVRLRRLPALICLADLLRDSQEKAKLTIECLVYLLTHNTIVSRQVWALAAALKAPREA